ncbi:conserved unknown protein [Ectocarpus siliculosus]|uniref:Uncharacterized protein n=1 Tax=Ectocarpus siliculosus TaxID=2880 RepID=D7G2X3_ECTSI|nr:conserved unknown protein [Ectocarpus siliculosus]|eukprot:CBJ48830.1 conserved unknown protein [Ectocarpus siliculosus]
MVRSSSSSSSSSLETSTTSDEYELLRGVSVKSASSGKEMDLLSAWEPAPGKKTIVAFFTHTADFNSWEYAQKLRHYLPQIDDAGVGVVGVSLGTVDAARDFCAETGFPLDNMFMDATGQAYSALGFSNGFEPRLPGDRKINPYLRLLPMLAGIGSPGTIQAVLKGYVGDPNSNADWVSSALSMVDNKEFDFLGTRGSRPLEVATLRLQNMRQIVTKWNKLAPPDKELITQQGGTVVFEGRDKIYNYKDKGILVYTDVLEMLKTIGVKL